MEKLRIDKYLWAIRLFKTRSLATEACDAGKVKWNAASVKPAKNVMVGEEYDIRTPARKWTIKVVSLLAQRMNFEEASKHYLDITSAEDLLHTKIHSSVFYTGKRLSKTGKPTKKQLRDRTDFLGDEG